VPARGSSRRLVPPREWGKPALRNARGDHRAAASPLDPGADAVGCEALGKCPRCPDAKLFASLESVPAKFLVHLACLEFTIPTSAGVEHAEHDEGNREEKRQERPEDRERPDHSS
jgi:hypothetical protein